VYTPPGYDEQTKVALSRALPATRGGEDETDWIKQGHANFILDNLIGHEARSR